MVKVGSGSSWAKVGSSWAKFRSSCDNQVGPIWDSVGAKLGTSWAELVPKCNREGHPKQFF
eukprot:787359-Karenia_brevis.AAC.1